jgi:hypothetical protein
VPRPKAAKKRAELDDKMKHFIVTQLAMYHTRGEVCDMVRDEFGSDLDMGDRGSRTYGDRVRVYDADCTYSSGKLSERWRTLFWETRNQYLSNIAKHAVAHKAVRLRSLGRMAGKAEDEGDYALAAKMLEQAAKEVGGVFTNESVVNQQVSLSGSITHGIAAMSEDERRLALEDRLNEAILRLPAPKIENTDPEGGR